MDNKIILTDEENLVLCNRVSRGESASKVIEALLKSRNQKPDTKQEKPVNKTVKVDKSEEGEKEEDLT